MKTLIWSMFAVGFVTSSAQAFDYVDSHGFRHWNHYDKSQSSKESVQNPGKPAVKIVQDTVRFVPVDEPERRDAAKE